MISKVLDRIKNNPNALAYYTTAVSDLVRSGVIEFMRERARVVIVGGGTDPQAMATQAARSAGYMQALDDILYFRELHIDSVIPLARVPLDFGGTDRAILSGDMTEEEANELRNSTL